MNVSLYTYIRTCIVIVFAFPTGGKCSFQVHLKMADVTTNKYYGAPVDIWVTYNTAEKETHPGQYVWPFTMYYVLP